MRRALAASLVAVFLGGSLSFGQDIVVKMGRPVPVAPPADVPNAVRTASYTAGPPTLPAALPTAAPAAAPTATPTVATTVVPTAMPVAAPSYTPVFFLFGWAYSDASAASAAAYSESGCDTWTGFYVGLNTGGAIGSGSTRDNAVFRSDALGANGLVSGSGHDAATAWIFGGQLGYDRQVSRFVVGVEADWEWMGQRDSNTSATPSAMIGFFGAGGNGFGYGLTDEHRIMDLGTIRARNGVVVGNSLIYATYGLAWGTVKETLSFRGSANPIIFPGALQPGPFLPADASSSQTRVGYALGGGIETKLSAHWSFKAEYVFVGLGKINHTAGIGINPIFGPAFTTGGVALANSSWLANDNIVRVGLNYRF